MAAPVTISESTAGPNFGASSAESVLVIVGCATDGEENLPQVARNDAQPAELHTSGPLVEVAAISIGEGRQPAVLLRAATVTPGDYGDLDASDFDGTAVASVGATVPTIASDTRIKFEAGGTLGTPGITYRTSPDDGVNWSGLQALGSETSILVAASNATIDLTIPAAQLTALIALLTELRTDRIAHYGTGTTVHLAADTTSDDGIAANPTDEATCISMVNTLRTAELLHATNNTAHTADDSVSYANMPPAATTLVEAAYLANFIKAASAVHNATLGSVHGAADTAHDTTADDVEYGTVEDGDELYVPTTAPLWDATTLAAALATLPTYQGFRFGGLAIVGAVTTADAWTAIINALDALELRQRPCCAILEARLPTDGEGKSAYRTSLSTFWFARRDNRVHVRAGDGRYNPTEVAQARYALYRSSLAPFCARHVALRFEQSHAIVDPSIARSLSAEPAIFGGPLRGFSIYDSNDQPIGYDESTDPGMVDLLFGTCTSYPQEGSACFAAEPVMRHPDNDTVTVMPIRRIVDVFKRVAYFRLTRDIQTMVLRVPGQTTMATKDANAINKQVLADLRGALKGRVSDITFAIDVQGSDVSVASPRIRWTASVTTGAYIAGFDGVVAVNK
jgi:hypothetical protein